MVCQTGVMRSLAVLVLMAPLGGFVGCGSDETEAPTTTTEPPTTTAELWPVGYRENFLTACVEANDDVSIQAAGEGCLCVLTNLKATMSIDEFIVLSLQLEEGINPTRTSMPAFFEAVEGCF